jgi:hypothetical protein
MTRILLIYKQHRFEVIGAIVVCLGLAIAALIEAFRLNSIVLPTGCSIGQSAAFYFGPNGPTPTEPTLACATALSQFYGIRGSIDVNLVSVGLIFSPWVVAIMFGAPLVAREVEQGTAPLSWALGGSRRQWLAWRIAAMAGLAVCLWLLVGLAGDALLGATSRTNPWATFQSYQMRGILVVFWCLAAFGGTLALGALFGRTVPAIFLAVVICLFAIVGGIWAFQKYVLAPQAQQLMTWAQMTDNGGGFAYSDQDLYVDYRWYLDGKPWDGDIQQWWNEHQPPAPDPGQAVAICAPEPTKPPLNPSGTPESAVASPSETTTALPGASPDLPSCFQPTFYGPQTLPFGFHGDMYWPVVAAESGILLGSTVLFGAIALFWVDKRKPY